MTLEKKNKNNSKAVVYEALLNMQFERLMHKDHLWVADFAQHTIRCTRCGTDYKDRVSATCSHSLIDCVEDNL